MVDGTTIDHRMQMLKLPNRKRWFVLLAYGLIGLLVFLACAWAMIEYILKPRSVSDVCKYSLAEHLIHARIWASNHNNQFPTNFTYMFRNDLRSMMCPSCSSTQCGYEIVTPGIGIDNTSNVFIRCRIHGHVGYADGRVLARPQ